MKLQAIVTLANIRTKLEFLAMERSLRSTGCKLPLLAIPYDEQLFELPENCHWCKLAELDYLLKLNLAHPSMRKYHCLTLENYHFVDTDVCFLRNPESVLENIHGFVTSCGHWHNVAHTVTNLSKSIMHSRSTTWQSKVFNSGQFASDRALYTQATIVEAITNRDHCEVTLHWPHNEQPGINLLTFLADVPYTNLTLPPHHMQSTWAGDYGGNYEDYWKKSEHKPYLIHWAGLGISGKRPIDRLFTNFLNASEMAELESKTRPKKVSLWETVRSLFRIFS